MHNQNDDQEVAGEEEIASDIAGSIEILTGDEKAAILERA